MEMDPCTRERCAGDNVDCVSKLGRNLESSSGPAIRDSFAETFKQTFKMSHPFPEHRLAFGNGVVFWSSTRSEIAGRKMPISVGNTRHSNPNSR